MRVRTVLLIAAVLSFVFFGRAAEDKPSYRFIPHTLLTYSLELDTEIHSDLNRLEKAQPVHSRLTLALYVLDVKSGGSAVLAADSRFEEGLIPPAAAEDDKPLRRELEKWMQQLPRESSAAFILDPWGNIEQGRMIWPEAPCFHIPRIMEGLTINPTASKGIPGGRIFVDPVFMGLINWNERVCQLYRTSRPEFGLDLFIDAQSGIPVGIDALYGYQTFRSYRGQKLTIRLESLKTDVAPESLAENEALSAAAVQAWTLAEKGPAPAVLIRRLLGSKIPGRRKIAAAALALGGLPPGIDVASLRKDPEEIVRFNGAKAEFRHLGRREELDKFLKSGAPELQVRAKSLLSGVLTLNSREAEIIAAFSSGSLVPGAYPDRDIYSAVRKSFLAKAGPSVHYGPKAFAAHSGLSGQHIFHWNIYLPDDYDPSERWPVMISLSGGNGYAESFFLDSIKIIPDHYIFVQPDSDYGLWWAPERDRMFDDLLAFLPANYSIDGDRIYLQGFSNGGVATYRYGFARADRFAAVASLEGYSMTPENPPRLETEMSLNMKTTPVLMIHGERDRTISPVFDRRLAEFMEFNDIPHKYIELSGVGHSVTFLNSAKAVLSFFRKAKRDPFPSGVTLVVDEPRYNRNFWLRVDEKTLPDRRAKIVAAIKKRRINVETENVGTFSLLLNDGQYAENDEIEIIMNGRRIFKDRLRLDPAVLADSIKSDWDPAHIYGVRLTFKSGIATMTHRPPSS